MRLLDLIQNRYSCRKYSDEAVTPQQIEYIKECVRLAPSAVNKQPWRFRIVDTDEGRDKIRQCYDREWFKSPQIYVIATVLHNEEWVRADGKAHGNIDIAIAVEHLCLAATEQGLGTCWVCNFNVEKCKELFSIPKDEEPAVLIPIGYPDERTSTKNRKHINEIWSQAE